MHNSCWNRSIIYTTCVRSNIYPVRELWLPSKGLIPEVTSKPHPHRGLFSLVWFLKVVYLQNGGPPLTGGDSFTKRTPLLLTVQIGKLGLKGDWNGAREVAHQVGVLAATPNDLSLIPKTHNRRKELTPTAVLWPPKKSHGTHAPTQK